MLLRFIRRGLNVNLPVTTGIRQPANAYGTKNEDEDKEWLEREPEEEHPFKRATRVLKTDFRRIKRKTLFWKDHSKDLRKGDWDTEDQLFPTHVDVLVIGGGAIGSSVAYWIKERVKDGLRVAVLEKDPTYKTASTVLSAGGLRQQFSLEENIEMSLFGADFIRNVEDHLGLPGRDPVDVQFHPHGYLFLASEAGAECLCKNSKLQNSLGARNVVLTASQLERKFPWLNTKGIAAGCLGLEKEGWFDPWALLFGLKRKAIAMGAQYVHGELKGFTYKNTNNEMIGDTNISTRQGLTAAIVKTPDGEKKFITFAYAVVAAGAHSGRIAEMAQIGVGPGILSVPLPVKPRKRFVFCFHSPDGPGINTPMTIDPSGAYFRREGLANHYIAGRSPDLADEPGVNNLDVDDKFFDEKVWPKIAHRVKSFENLKVKSSWAGFYEYNEFDENGIVGRHPYYMNLLFATGFSGHGIQQAPAVGRAIAELIIDSEFISLDLTRLGFDRFISLEPMKEINIV
ncbi:FAD-dependent oxidoreductase domain-containing protein 1 [Venturia canescens]|uniref:FAD-dependent oxidoreductase domain-containing protein 1 n=1 Tax=Venturia canescens TaxID=32260 RepID=UPI001C9D1A6B|nr:FAD-dependent oxidoreductase domain-containing protein 1 [Venturia canescens]